MQLDFTIGYGMTKQNTEKSIVKKYDTTIQSSGRSQYIKLFLSCVRFESGINHTPPDSLRSFCHDIIRSPGRNYKR